MYGTGAAMGYTPAQTGEMSVWEFLAARDGYIRANSTEDNKELTSKELDDLWDWIKDS